ncbi:MAG TPA: type II toxin-antitoxin system prevent-host-death family antitoxin [Caulobacteraceae bacterium]|jgi:prevent-host-death family protein
MPRSLTVAAAEANRSFSKLLRAAKEGARIVITSHGEPIAELGPVSQAEADDAEQQQIEDAHAQMEARWAATENRVVGPWTRSELYDD